MLFNVCFNTGCIPSLWGKSIINPIPKSSSADQKDPLSYRGISLSASMYKLYSSLLNNRLSVWSENNDKIVDEQNGFRKKRRTIDQLSSLTNIIDTRKKLKLSTFCAFIDFKKAYDYINRDKLWERLQHIGISIKTLIAVKSLYTSVSCCVRVNNFHTNWFQVNSGLRQGCSLSPLLFNLFINDLALRIKSLGRGICIDDENISILMYADDIVLIAKNEENLQHMLNELHNWCSVNSMTINCTKSNIVHFRPLSIAKSNFIFTCGENILLYTDKYVYLGLTLTDHLDYNVTAKIVAQSAGRALGLLIAKYKSLGGMPYNVFTKLFDSLVWSVVSYGVSIWGVKSYSCINSIQNRAMRFFLGTGKYTPTAAISGDMGWSPPIVKQWKCISRHWLRNIRTTDTRLNRRIFNWANRKSNNSCYNWFFTFKNKFVSLQLHDSFDIYSVVNQKQFIDAVYEKLMSLYIVEWKESVNRTTGIRGNGRNKLRTYSIFKTDYETENYCKLILPMKHRSAFAKFRCGVAPLKLETGRYEGIIEIDRLCPICNNDIEDECHVVLKCTAYQDIRK